MNWSCSAFLTNAEKQQGSTYQFEVVILRLWEIKQQRKAKRKAAQADKTAWEKNLSRLKTKHNQLDAEKPIKPVKLSS